MSLSKDDISRLDDELSPQKFEQLREEWQNLVGSLDGYNFSIYDYDNDVQARVLIQEAAARCPVAVQVNLWSSLATLDHAFLDKTRPVQRSSYPANAWQARLPAAPGAELLQDIESGNL